MIALALAACQTADIFAGSGSGASASAAEQLASIRAANGLPRLSADPQLERAALQQASYMARAGRMTHRTGFGKDFSSRMRANGVAGASAENVAVGRFESSELLARWMGSAGHRRNMLDPRFTRFGLASVEASPGSTVRYWALVLGR
jgi:uncharacterized protein YkwD